MRVNCVLPCAPLRHWKYSFSTPVFQISRQGHAMSLSEKELTRYNRQMLIVFDNCEHLINDCALMIKQILSACLSIKILVTSRESLGVAGEVSFIVPSMRLPVKNLKDEQNDIWEIEAMRLFFDRAALV